jgi:long-subunit fatty acid transport protein
VLSRKPLVLALLAMASFAQAGDGAGSSGAEFLTIGVGARPAGMADAYSGLADDVHALHYNPAGAALLRRRELALDHDSYAPGVNHEWVGYAHPTAWGTFGGSANLLFVAPFESYDAFDSPSGKTSASDMAYQFSYATTVTEKWAVGLSAKYIRSRLHDVTASTLAGDVGAMWTPLPRLRVGASALNFGPGLRYLAATSDLPTTLRGGASWTPLDPHEFRNTITLAVDVEKRREETARLGGGLELCYDNSLALRAGGRSLPGSGTGLTLGLGVYLFRDDSKGFEVDFDYAFAAAGDFSTSHRAGLVFKFGEPLTSAPRAAVLQKSEIYYQDAPKAKPRRDPIIAAPLPPRKPRPASEPSQTPNDVLYVP